MKARPRRTATWPAWWRKAWWRRTLRTLQALAHRTAERHAGAQLLGDALRDELGVTCFIAVMGNQGPTILRIEEPALPVVVNVRAGSVLPLLWSATGQAFLAWSEGAQIDTQARRDWDGATPVQRAQLKGKDPVAGLRARVRAQGLSSVEGLLSPGISAVAAPIRLHTGQVAAVLTALGAAGGFDAAPEGRIATRVRQEADAISAALGFDGERG
jgi:DNA-binding IclR family transcriptional regulator